MKFKRLKNTWFIANKHYLIPAVIVLAAVDAALAVLLIMIASFFWVRNKLRARLPIDSGFGGEVETIVFKDIPGPDLKIDIWRPQNGGPGLATIVFAHGGGWISGSRNQSNIVSWCRFLSSRGFTVVSVDYRFAYTYKMDTIIGDFSDAVDFVRTKAEVFGISSKMILMGLSAGGHLALCHAAFNTLAQDQAAVRAMNGVRGVVAYYSPSDLTDLFSAEDKSFFARFGAGSAMKTLPVFDEEIYEKYSPINSLTERMVPVMAVHGRNDEIVPYHTSVKTIKRLKELGVYCRFLVHKTGGHGFEVKRKDYRTTLILEETVRFMRKLSEAE